MSLKIICPHCRKPLGREGFEKGSICPHCGKPTALPEPAPASDSNPPNLEARVRAAPRGLSLASFLLGLGVLLIPLGILVGAYLSDNLGPTVVTPLCLGGLALLLVGTIVNNVIVWRHRRSRGAGSKLALSALLAGAAGLMVIIALFLLPLFGIGLDGEDNGTEARGLSCNVALETTALGYCRNISIALLLFHKDTGTWPMYASADHSPDSRLDYLYGKTEKMPQFEDEEVRASWGTRSQDMFFQLVTNGRQEPIYPYGPKDASPPRDSATGPRGWVGPYLPYVTEDPWGFAYLVSVSGFEGGARPDNHVWCLSAGPNGIVDTPAWATATRGDDVGYRTDVGY